MQHQQMLKLAEQAAKTARPLESNFCVGAYAEFSNNQFFSGSNIEDFRKTPVGVCAERALLYGANSQIGPLSKDGGVDGQPVWEQMAVWGPTEHPITPCGICRDALAGSGHPDSLIFSRGSNGQILEATISQLLPLPGLGVDGDASYEVERLIERGADISASISPEFKNLLEKAKSAADNSYIPPFSNEPRAGAAIELSNQEIITGWVTIDATTRLGGSAITSAARNALGSSLKASSRAVRIALFTDALVLRAPNGYDLQMLQELADPDTLIVFGCSDNRAYISRLDTLLPHAFGRRDLGY